MRRTANHRAGTSSTEIPALVWRFAWGPIESDEYIIIFHLEKGIKQSRGEEFTKGKSQEFRSPGVQEFQETEVATKPSSCSAFVKASADKSSSCSNESGNSGTELDCQLACSAIRLKHGCAASFRPGELDVTSRSDESRKTNRKPGPPTNWTGSSVQKCWNQSHGRQLCTQSNLREFAASYPQRATTD